MNDFWRHAITLTATMVLMGAFGFLGLRKPKSGQHEDIYRVVAPLRYLSILFIGIFIVMAYTAKGTLFNRIALISVGTFGVACFCLLPFLQYEIRSEFLVRKLLIWERRFLLADLVSCKPSNWSDLYIVTDIKGRKMEIPYFIRGCQLLAEKLQTVIRANQSADTSTSQGRPTTD
jgi:hypothetical protein